MASVSGASLVAQSLTRPYRVPWTMVLFFCLIPLYVLIPAFFPPQARHLPVLAMDRAWPLVPYWSIVYGALYLFVILLPVFVVRHDELIRRTLRAYLLCWITAYLCFFVLYPTAAPRPAVVTGEGFGVWGLRALYSADPPHNCLPSLHVAHSFVSALAVLRVHRGLGAVTLAAGALVALSTLFTKQHYVLDVASGIVLALVAWRIFLARYPSDQVPELDRRAAPALGVLVAGIVAVVLLGSWLAYRWGGETRFTFTP